MHSVCWVSIHAVNWLQRPWSDGTVDLFLCCLHLHKWLFFTFLPILFALNSKIQIRHLFSAESNDNNVLMLAAGQTKRKWNSSSITDYLQNVYLGSFWAVHLYFNCRLIALTDELLLKITAQEELEHITVLNLHGNGLSKLKPLQPLRMLKRLVVSFNELTRLDDLTHMVRL